VFVDPDCPACARLARRLQRWLDGRLQVDPIGAAAPGTDVPGRLLLLRQLHLRTADGRWLSGIDAALRVAAHTPLRQWARPLHWPVIYPLAARLFDRWELRRYRRLYGCADCRDTQRM